MWDSSMQELPFSINPAQNSSRMKQKRLRVKGLLGGSWVDISGGISRVTVVIVTHTFEV